MQAGLAVPHWGPPRQAQEVCAHISAVEFDLKLLLVSENDTASFFLFPPAKLCACVWEQVDGRGTGPVVRCECPSITSLVGFDTEIWMTWGWWWCCCHLRKPHCCSTAAFWTSLSLLIPCLLTTLTVEVSSASCSPREFWASFFPPSAGTQLPGLI